MRTRNLIAVILAFCSWRPAPAGAAAAPPLAAPDQNAAGLAASAALQARLAVEDGNRLRRQRDFSAALRAYHRAIRLQPDNSNAWFYLGIAYVNLDRFEEARLSFKRSLLNAPDDPAKWMGLCLADYLLADFDAVIRACRETLRLDPRQADAWAWLGLSYARQQSLEKSLQCLEIATALGTSSSQAWYTLGMRYARLGLRSRVMDVYRHLEQLDPAQAQRFLRQAVAPKSRG